MKLGELKKWIASLPPGIDESTVFIVAGGIEVEGIGDHGPFNDWILVNDGSESNDE